MCGRFALLQTPQDLADWFDLDAVEPFPPRYNIAPTQPILMVANGPAGRRQAILVRWGLVPAWVKEPGDFTLLLNARSESVAEKPSFRNAMRHRRTLVPASGFYEWHRPADKSAPKQAYWVKPAAGNPPIVAFGGLMETWIGANGSEIDTGCILTTGANPDFARIHHRMPVVIERKDFGRWLDCVNYGPAEVADLMRPPDQGLFEAVAVSDRVNKVAHSGPEVQEPLPPGLGHNSSAAAGQGGKARPAGKDDGQFSLF
ncbi:MAG: SOS response-associated peptidase [Nitratireductor sp.]|nr:SOS response-associated peptidase [Nitratireductor sp.]